MSRLVLTLIAVMALSFAEAKVLPTGPDVRAFLGGRTGKLIYIKTVDHKLYFIDFSDSIMVERKVSDDAYVLNPKISPDGSRVVYESYGTIWVRELVGNSTQRHAVMAAPLRSGYFYEPRWWIHPVTGDEYILWSTGEVAFGEWPPTHEGAGTYLRRIKGTQIDSTVTTLLPFTMAGGRSRDGKWGGTANHSTGMFRLSPEKTSYAFIESKNWMDGGAYLSCNASISPSKEPLRMNRMLHLTSGFGTLGGKVYDNHKAVIMRSWEDTDLDHPVWYMGPLGDRVDDDGSGNIFWDYPEWSNDEDYFAVTGSTIINGWDTADVYLIKINLEGNSKPLRVIQGGGINHVPDLWVKDGVQPARLRLERSSVRFVSLRKDTAAPVPQQVGVSNAGDGTLPTLKIGPLPKWLKVTVTGNGSNAPVLVNEVLRDSVAVGEHRATVGVSFGGGVDSASYTVDFSYRDPVLTRLVPKPLRAVLEPGQSLFFSAQPRDQTGAPLTLASDTALNLQWSAPATLVPPGSQNPPAGARNGLMADGHFTADATLPAPYGFLAVGRVSVSQGSGGQGGNGEVTCTTEVRVVRRYARIDAGWMRAQDDGAQGVLPGNGMQAASNPAPGNWDNTPLFTATSAAGASDRALHRLPDSLRIDASWASDPAPDTVYRSFERLGSFQVPGLPKGRYRVRIHGLMPGYVDPASAGAVSLRLEGRAAFEGSFPLPAKDSTWFAVTAEALVTVSDTDGLSGEFTSWGGPSPSITPANANAGFFVSAIEVYDLGLPPVTVTAPNGGESVAIGDTVRIRWQTDGFITSVGIQVSLDSGKRWIPLTRTASVEEGEEAWGNYAWVVPDSLDGLSLTSGQAMISVYDYFGSDRDRSDAVFAIRYPAAGLRPGQVMSRLPPFAARWQAGAGLRVQGLQPGMSADLALLNARGRWQASTRHHAVSTQGTAIWQIEGMGSGAVPGGAYRLMVRQNGRMLSALVVID